MSPEFALRRQALYGHHTSYVSYAPLMESLDYVLRAKARHVRVDPERLVGFDLTVERRGEGLGGNNVQAMVGAPTEERYGLDEQVALWLPSGWWVSLRNQFAAQPEVGSAIVCSAADELGEITSRATDATGAEAEAVQRELFERTFPATGPDYWR